MKQAAYPSVREITRKRHAEVAQEIFETIPAGYDLLNRVLSLRRDVAWRRFAVEKMRFFQTRRLLDLATGTADLALAAARRHDDIEVVGLDFVREMLARGREKIWDASRRGRRGGGSREAWREARGGGPPEARSRGRGEERKEAGAMTPFAGAGAGGRPRRIGRDAAAGAGMPPDDDGVPPGGLEGPSGREREEVTGREGNEPAEGRGGGRICLVQGDIRELPLRSEGFDVAAIAFGIRNVPVADRPAALKEMTRCVVPGGQVMILEMHLPESPCVRPLYRAYLNHLLPRIAGLLTANPAAYHYLADSIVNFPSPAAFGALMTASGLRDIVQYPLTFGATCLHIGRK